MKLFLPGGEGRASDDLSVVDPLYAEASGTNVVYIADECGSQPDKLAKRPDAKMAELITAGEQLAPLLGAIDCQDGRTGFAGRALFDFAKKLAPAKP